MEKMGQGDVALGLPSPLGREGVSLIAFLKRMKSDRISPEPGFF
jgi:hypothetical protein